MIARIARSAFAVAMMLMAGWPVNSYAQDVPGIDICTVE